METHLDDVEEEGQEARGGGECNDGEATHDGVMERRGNVAEKASNGRWRVGPER